MPIGAITCYAKVLEILSFNPGVLKSFLKISLETTLAFLFYILKQHWHFYFIFCGTKDGAQVFIIAGESSASLTLLFYNYFVAFFLTDKNLGDIQVPWSSTLEEESRLGTLIP